MKFSKLIFCIASATLISGCYYDTEEKLYPKNSSQPCDTTTIKYSLQVTEIISSNCNSCHSQSAALGNVILEGYNNLKVYADNGKLMGSITNKSGFSPMPKGGNKLNDCNIATIQKWIIEGTNNN